ncbi:hypothetical protein [Nostoc sp. C057]|uniref:hypothetical protein n=1 Tax=Nostoc sp. C057 TaxID=2576903 RepID=UPI0015C337AC|nr:hypothetical protein [Nostoc sp. C057]
MCTSVAWETRYLEILSESNVDIDLDDESAIVVAVEQAWVRFVQLGWVLLGYL